MQSWNVAQQQKVYGLWSTNSRRLSSSVCGIQYISLMLLSARLPAFLFIYMLHKKKVYQYLRQMDREKSMIFFIQHYWKTISLQTNQSNCEQQNVSKIIQLYIFGWVHTVQLINSTPTKNSFTLDIPSIVLHSRLITYSYLYLLPSHHPPCHPSAYFCVLNQSNLDM